MFMTRLEETTRGNQRDSGWIRSRGAREIARFTANTDVSKIPENSLCSVDKQLRVVFLAETNKRNQGCCPENPKLADFDWASSHEFKLTSELVINE